VGRKHSSWPPHLLSPCALRWAGTQTSTVISETHSGPWSAFTSATVLLSPCRGRFHRDSFRSQTHLLVSPWGFDSYACFPFHRYPVSPAHGHWRSESNSVLLKYHSMSDYTGSLLYPPNHGAASLICLAPDGENKLTKLSPLYMLELCTGCLQLRKRLEHNDCLTLSRVLWQTKSAYTLYNAIL